MVDLRFWEWFEAQVPLSQDWLLEIGERCDLLAAGVEAFGGLGDADPNVIEDAGLAAARVQQANDRAEIVSAREGEVEGAVGPLPAIGFEFGEFKLGGGAYHHTTFSICICILFCMVRRRFLQVFVFIGAGAIFGLLT